MTAGRATRRRATERLVVAAPLRGLPLLDLAADLAHAYGAKFGGSGRVDVEEGQLRRRSDAGGDPIDALAVLRRDPQGSGDRSHLLIRMDLDKIAEDDWRPEAVFAHELAHAIDRLDRRCTGTRGRARVRAENFADVLGPWLLRERPATLAEAGPLVPAARRLVAAIAAALGPDARVGNTGFDVYFERSHGAS
jgi:hypothetical protein